MKPRNIGGGNSAPRDPREPARPEPKVTERPQAEPQKPSRSGFSAVDYVLIALSWAIITLSVLVLISGIQR